MEINDTEALAAVLAFGGEPRTYHAPENATVRLVEGIGHLLTGAVITSWCED